MRRTNDELTDILRQALIDRLEGWELVEFLQIPIEDIVEVYEDLILQEIEDVKDFINLKRDENTEDGYEY